MVDADIANPVVGNATHPLVFWLVTNIREGNMSTGTDNSIVLYTHYHNSNLIWRTVSRRVDEVMSSDHLRRIASRVIQCYGLIHET